MPDNAMLCTAIALCAFALGCLTGAKLMRDAMQAYVNRMTKIEPKVKP